MATIIYQFASKTYTKTVEEEFLFKKKGKKATTRTRMVNQQVTEPTWIEPKADPNTGILQPSHDSAMVEAEVLRIVKDGVQLLTQQSLRTVQDTRDGEMLDVYKALTGDRTEFVTILKGIHQRETRPHITVRLVGERTLHIWISPDSDDARFAWKAIGVSASAEGALIPPCIIQGVRRRGSVSLDVLTAERLAASLEEVAQ
jgi:hypothetical protein